MSATRTLAKAGLIVSVAFLVSRLLGYVRGIAMATTFDAGQSLDSFFAAFRLPDLIFQLVAAGALSSALIPIVSGLIATDEEARAWRIVSTVTTLMLAALLVLAVVAFVLAPLLVPLMTPGWAGIRLERTVELTRIMLLSPIFLALGSIATSALNAKGRFAASAVAPSVYNIGMIVGAVVLAPALGTTGADGVTVPNPAGLAAGVVLGSLAHLAVQLPPLLRLGFRYEPRMDIEDALARKALVLMAPRAIGLGATQITFVAMTILASDLPDGSLSAFNLAMLLLQIPLGVIGVPLGIVLLPALSRELATGTVEEFLGMIGRALRLLLFVMLPIAALGIVLSREVVDLLFGYGAFSNVAAQRTAATFVVFLTGLAAHALIAILARAFYAGQDTTTPVVAAITAVVINVTVGVLAVGPFGLAGLALAIAAGAWIEATILLVVLRSRYAGLDLRGMFRTFGRSMAGALVAAALAFGMLGSLRALLGSEPDKLVVLIQAALAAGVGAVGYLAMSFVLRVPELPALIAVATELVRRPRGP